MKNTMNQHHIHHHHHHHYTKSSMNKGFDANDLVPWKLDLEVNGTIITTSNAFYPYESKLLQQLNYGKGASDSQLELFGHKKDTAGQMDDVDLKSV